MGIDWQRPFGQTFGDWALVGIVVLGILFILNAFFPFIVAHGKCYEKIAKAECPDRDVYLSNGAPFIETSFQCCTNASKETRKWTDNIIDCDSYIFFEEDHKKCSNRYYLFGLRVVD